MIFLANQPLRTFVFTTLGGIGSLAFKRFVQHVLLGVSPSPPDRTRKVCVQIHVFGKSEVSFLLTGTGLPASGIPLYSI